MIIGIIRGRISLEQGEILTHVSVRFEEVVKLMSRFVCILFLRKQPIRVVEQGYYHVIVNHVYSGVQHPMI